MSRRVLITGVAVVAVAGIGVGAVTTPWRDDTTPTSTTSSKDEPTTSTAEVVRTDLVANEELDATLGFGDPVEVSVAGQGVVTALPAVGSTVERGGSIVEVNGKPTVLLYGSRPFWRTLTDNPLGADGQPTGEDMTGPDVQILEENLQALGFIDADSSAKVDDTFTGSTAEAVKEWQASLGLTETGVVEPGDVTVLAGPARIAEHVASLGGQAGGPVVKVTSTQRDVLVALDAARQDLVEVGEAVQVELPDGTVVPAKVAVVGTEVTPGDEMQGTSDTITVTVRFDDPAAAGDLMSAAVVVQVPETQVTDVLAVPVAALLALSEGGYAVERIGGRDSAGDGTQLVGVEVGAFADGKVQIQGDVAEGDTVVVPE